MYRFLHILDDDDATAGSLLCAALSTVSIHILVLFLLRLSELRHTYADAEFASAFVTLEYQRLAFRVFRLVKDDVVVALGASYALHK